MEAGIIDMVNKGKKKKGYALLITILVTFFIGSLALAAFSSVYKYTAFLNKSKTELIESVR